MDDIIKITTNVSNINKTTFLCGAFGNICNVTAIITQNMQVTSMKLMGGAAFAHRHTLATDKINNGTRTKTGESTNAYERELNELVACRTVGK